MWARFHLNGAHRSPRYGLPATGQRVGVAAVEIARFASGKLEESWCFGDELRLLLQRGVPDLLHER